MGVSAHIHSYSSLVKRLLKVSKESASTVVLLRRFHCGTVRGIVACHRGECLSLAAARFNFQWCAPRVVLPVCLWMPTLSQGMARSPCRILNTMPSLWFLRRVSSVAQPSSFKRAVTDVVPRIPLAQWAALRCTRSSALMSSFDVGSQIAPQ